MKSAAPIAVPVPRRDIPVIGADIISMQLWPSLGAIWLRTGYSHCPAPTPERCAFQRTIVQFFSPVQK